VEQPRFHSGEGQEAALACVVHADPPTTVSLPSELFLIKLFCFVKIAKTV